MTSLVLKFLISFREVPWYGLVYYMWANITTWWGQCATSIWFKISKFTVIYQHMSSSCYCEIHWLCLFIVVVFLSKINTSFYYFSLLIIIKFYFSQNVWMNYLVIFCNRFFCYRQVHLRPPKIFDHLHNANISVWVYIRGRAIVVREIVTLI